LGRKLFQRILSGNPQLCVRPRNIDRACRW